MGEVRALFGSFSVAFSLALAIVACGSTSTVDSATADEADAEPPRVPDPPPRYKPLQLTDASPVEAGGPSELTIKCGRDKPYVCALEDGTFACSSVPCIPDCTRIGCVGGETCTACDGGFRCLASGEAC